MTRTLTAVPPVETAGLRCQPPRAIWETIAADLRLAALGSDGRDGLRGGHEHRDVRERCGACAGPGTAARRRGDLGQSQAAPVLEGRRSRHIEAAFGARVVRLPSSSPDLTPIEEMFSKVKEALRSAGKRTKQAVSEAIVSALHDVTLEDIAGWSPRPCGAALSAIVKCSKYRQKRYLEV